MIPLVLAVVGAAALAAVVYLGVERLGRAGVLFAGLRTVAFGALIVALFNPVSLRRGSGLPPTVLLDASLSMNGPGGHWTDALDSARALAGTDGTILEFGSRVVPGDGVPPDQATTRLGPALRVAAARRGPVIVITDGELDDATAIPASLLFGVRTLALVRDTVPDAALLDVSIAERIPVGDSIPVRVTVGAWRLPDTTALRLEVFRGDRRLWTGPVAIPAGAAPVRRTFTLPPRAVPPGRHVLRFRLVGAAGDREPRDDERLRVVTGVDDPAIVVVADPADPEGRFLARELARVSGQGVRGFARVAADRWVTMGSGRIVDADRVHRAVRAAAMVVVRSGRRDGFAAPAVWFWPAGSDDATELFAGDWYVTADVPASPLAGRLAAVRWDSVPPLAGLVPLVAGGEGWTALTGRRGRRGAGRPLLIGSDSSGVRTLVTAAAGFWQWALRGGEALEAYRTVLAAGTDWLLATEEGTPAVPLVADAWVPRGHPVVFRWRGAERRDSLTVQVTGADSTRNVPLAFDPGGEARLVLAPGVYRWSVPGRQGWNGMVAVETWSDEFPPRPVVLAAGSGMGGERLLARHARERWWLFLLAAGAFLAEWALRQRRGLP